MRHLLNNVAVFASVDGAPRIRGYVWKREMMKAFPQAGKLNPNTNILFECGGIRDLCKGEWMKAFQQAGNLNRGIMCSCVLPCMISGEEESPDSAMTLIVLSRSSNTSPKAPTTQQSRADHSLRSRDIFHTLLPSLQFKLSFNVIRILFSLVLAERLNFK